MNKKELHIWMGMSHPTGMSVSLEETEWLLNNGEDRVDTPQTHVCSTAWILKGYRIFVHMLDGECVEMKIGYMGEGLQEIRVAQDIEKMVLSGCFGLATSDYPEQIGEK